MSESTSRVEQYFLRAARLRQPILSFTGWRTQVLQIDLQNSDRRYRIIKRATTGMGNRPRLKRKGGSWVSNADRLGIQKGNPSSHVSASPFEPETNPAGRTTRTRHAAVVWFCHPR